MKSPTDLNDCFVTDKERLTHMEALDLLRERIDSIAGVEPIPLEQSGGRILAERVTAPFAIPRADNSAVDGYAFCSADYEATGGFFAVGARIAAGHPAKDGLIPGQAARIFTGGLMPERADTVAMQEDCDVHHQEGQEFTIIPPGLKAGANRRRSGEDLAEGAEIACAGHELRPQDVAALASAGLKSVAVRKKLTLSLISTGDEVTRPGEPLRDGGVYDSNFHLLRALIPQGIASASDGGVQGDLPSQVMDSLRAAAAENEVVITTGGASRGEEDHVISALDALGTRHLWQIAVKPGRPLTFGQIKRGDGQPDCFVFGLPGNPVAAFVCFLLYVRPALFALAGGQWREPMRYPVRADFDLPAKKPDRREFLRGILSRDPEGGVSVKKFDRDGSGILTGLRESHGLIELGEEVRQVRSGSTVSFIPYSEFGIPAR